MKQQADWELVDDEPQQPRPPFGQQDFQKNILYALLGKYPRLKLVGLATMGVLIVALIAVFSLIALAGATLAGVLVLFVAWCKAKFSKNRKTYQVHVYGK